MITTVAVSFTASDQNGHPVSGARYRAKLSATELDGGFIVPEVVEAISGVNGTGVLHLWPNALGVNGSSYRVQAWNPDTGRRFLDATVVVPNSDCNLHEILVQEPYPAIDAAQQALIAAQAALAPVTAQAQIATSAAGSAVTAKDAAQQSAAYALWLSQSALASSQTALMAANQAVAAQEDIHANWQAKLDAAEGFAIESAASFGSFDIRYLGAKTIAPTLDNDGNTLLVGSKYFNSAENKMYVLNTANAWQLDTADSDSVNYLPAGTGAVAMPVQSKLREIVSRAEYLSDASFNSAKHGKLSVDAANRLRSTAFIAGTEELAGATVRDAFVVGRDVTGSTDCHAFADRTIIDSVTDAGTYGTFDATTELRGSHTQNHMYAFQDRNEYAGSGVLQDMTGLMSVPVLSGSGTVDSRQGVDIRDVSKTGAGTLSANIGVLVRDLASGVSNVGINIAQTTGYAIFAGGGAKSRHIGQFGIGTEPAAGSKLHVDGGTGVNDVAVLVAKTNGYSLYSNNNSKMYHYGNVGFGLQQNADGVALTAAGGATGPRAYMHTSATVAYFGQIGGNYPIQWVSNGGVRLELSGSGDGYSFTPGADNTQPLGLASKRWSTVFAGTGIINTSDERAKQDISALNDAEKRVAIAVKGLVKKFRFKDAVIKKGAAARIHVGVIAQEVMTAFQAEGLDPMQYGIVCYDKWDAGEKGNKVRSSGNRYGVRYEELLAFIVAA